MNEFKLPEVHLNIVGNHISKYGLYGVGKQYFQYLKY